MSRPLFKNKKNKKYEETKTDDFMDDIYDDDEEDFSLFDKIKSPPKVYVEEEDNDLSILDTIINGGKSYKEREKEEKKRRKKEEKKLKKKQKKENKKYKDKEDSMIDLAELYDDLEVKKRKLERDNEEFYNNRFGGSMVLLKELMKQVNSQLVNNIAIQDQLKGTKMRGGLNALTTQSANINSLLGTKLNVIKEINNISKTVSDLELKKMKEMAASGGANGGAMDEERIMSDILGKIVNDDIDTSSIKLPGDDDDKPKKKKSKKKNKIRDFDDDDEGSLLDIVANSRDDEEDTKKRTSISGIEEEYTDEDDIEVDYDTYEDDEEDRDIGIYPDDYDDIDEALEARINKLVEDDELQFSDTELAYKYEGNVEIIVDKNADNERWEFVAIDTETGDEIFDYPLPLKKSIGSVTFDRENGLMKDKLGNVYRVVYSRSSERVR